MEEGWTKRKCEDGWREREHRGPKGWAEKMESWVEEIRGSARCREKVEREACCEEEMESCEEGRKFELKRGNMEGEEEGQHGEGDERK